MRQLHTTEQEQNQRLVYAVAPEPLAVSSQRQERLQRIEETNAVTQLIEQCSRDAPLVETLHGGVYFANVLVPVLAYYLAVSGSWPAGVASLSVLVGMNVGIRYAVRNGIVADAARFGEVGIEALPALIEALVGTNYRIEELAAQVVSQLIPTMTESQLLDLPSNSRKDLYWWVRSSSSSCGDARTSIMQALARISDESLAPSIEQIVSRRAWTPAARRRRAVARTALQHLLERVENQGSVHASVSPDTTETQAASVEGSESQALIASLKSRSEKRASPGMRIGFLIANYCVLTPCLAVELLNSFDDKSTILTRILLAGLTIASTQLYRVALMPRHTRMAKQLAASGGIQAIGPLAEALEWPDQEIENIARLALIRLLPQMSMADAPLLNSRQRRSLNSRLVLAGARNYMESELQVAILSAFEKVGDLSSLQAVRSVAASTPVLQNERKVHRAALKCLPILEEIAQHNQSSQVLLRASAQPEAHAETLVRPASADSTPDNELLRPGA